MKRAPIQKYPLRKGKPKTADEATKTAEVGQNQAATRGGRRPLLRRESTSKGERGEGAQEDKIEKKEPTGKEDNADAEPRGDEPNSEVGVSVAEQGTEERDHHQEVGGQVLTNPEPVIEKLNDTDLEILSSENLPDEEKNEKCTDMSQSMLGSLSLGDIAENETHPESDLESVSVCSDEETIMDLMKEKEEAMEEGAKLAEELSTLKNRNDILKQELAEVLNALMQKTVLVIRYGSAMDCLGIRLRGLLKRVEAPSDWGIERPKPEELV